MTLQEKIEAQMFIKQVFQLRNQLQDQLISQVSTEVYWQVSNQLRNQLQDQLISQVGREIYWQVSNQLKIFWVKTMQFENYKL